MKISTTLFILLIAGLALGLAASPAQAQATRTWVSGVGDDVNPCSRTAPCKTFPGAIPKTAAGGEINCLDPGGFGAVTITKSITISCESGTAGVLIGAGNGITVNVPAGTFVELKGLDIDGTNGAGAIGVSMVSGGNLAIVNCNIYGFTTGVSVTGINAAHVTVENSVVRANGTGISLVPSPSANNSMMIERSLVDSNSTANLAVATGGTAVISQSALVGSPNAITITGTGAVISYGNNVIRNAGLPTSTVPLQ